MEQRSTNSKFTHFTGDVLSNVDDSSFGVKLSMAPASAGSGGMVEATGDTTNIDLVLRGKGAGAVRVGSSGAAFFTGGSTAPFGGFVRYRSTAVATPDFNTTNAMVVQTSVTLTGVNSSHFITGHIVNNGVASTDFVVVGIRPTSTNNEVLIHMAKHSTVTVAAGTCTMEFLVVRF